MSIINGSLNFLSTSVRSVFFEKPHLNIRHVGLMICFKILYVQKKMSLNIFVSYNSTICNYLLIYSIDVQNCLFICRITYNWSKKNRWHVFGNGSRHMVEILHEVIKWKKWKNLDLGFSYFIVLLLSKIKSYEEKLHCYKTYFTKLWKCFFFRMIMIEKKKNQYFKLLK